MMKRKTKKTITAILAIFLAAAMIVPSAMSLFSGSSSSGEATVMIQDEEGNTYPVSMDELEALLSSTSDQDLEDILATAETVETTAPLAVTVASTDATDSGESTVEESDTQSADESTEESSEYASVEPLEESAEESTEE